MGARARVCVIAFSINNTCILSFRSSMRFFKFEFTRAPITNILFDTARYLMQTSTLLFINKPRRVIGIIGAVLSDDVYRSCRIRAKRSATRRVVLFTHFWKRHSVAVSKYTLLALRRRRVVQQRRFRPYRYKNVCWIYIYIYIYSCNNRRSQI